MLSEFHIITITHNDLNVDEIGHFVVKHKDQTELKDRLTTLKNKFGIKELIYLSTCNRVSYICYYNDVWNADKLRDFFSTVNPDLEEQQLNKLNKFVQLFNGEDAINHLFEVASSIDSLVVGEREIFRQFREAYYQSREFGLSGDNLRLLEKYTVIAAKEVYANTGIGEKPLSIVSLAMQKLLAQQVDTASRILMIGAGETNRLMAKFMHKNNYTNAAIFNRNLDNAAEISELLDSPAYHLKDLKNYRKGFDVIVVATGSTSSLIDTVTYKSLIQKDHTPKLIIDLSVPRNVDEEVVETFNIHYVGIEELRVLAENNLQHRKKEVVQARKLLKERIKEFRIVFQQRKIEKAMSKVPVEVKKVKHKAIHSVFKKDIDQLDSQAQAVIIQMMDYMEKKCISIPMKMAKKVVKD